MLNINPSLPTVLINAYVISPYKGSEASVAWNHVRIMSRYFNLIVLYGASGNYMGDNIDIPKWQENAQLENVSFIFVEPKKLPRLFTSLNKRGLTIFHHLAFKLWQKTVLKKAREITDNYKVDLVHQLGPIGYREPGYLWKLPQPFIWGPIGGLNNAPNILANRLPLKGKIWHKVRTLSNMFYTNYGTRIKKALRKAVITIGATSECADIITKLSGKETPYLAENCIDSTISLNRKKFNSEIIRIIFMGRLDANKAVNIQLEALNLLKDLSNWHFDIIGDGPLKDSLKQYTIENGLDSRVTFHGFVQRHEAQKFLNNAWVQMITSVSEGNPTTVWEAMSKGVPTITLDHCGMHDTINEKNGIKIPIVSYSQIVNDLAESIKNLLLKPQILKDLAESTIKESSNYLPEARAKLLYSYYNQAIESKEE